ncbi:MAG TPA: DEAD/DEAH box helicase [Jatrophihabitans sp.]
MSELLPTVQAASIRRSLLDYLTTTFALADPDVRDALDRFLSDPDTGMFKGPYVRLRVPFRPADEGWRDLLEWYGGFPPYGHQAAAFARLSSSIRGERRRPQPTLVTTGTGSGKTEAFLYPILDHVLRARREGVTGTKALILYPMNALANDQAKRLTDLLTAHSELSVVTAALYTGQDGPTRTSVTKDGLITDRAVMRDTAPDILLTNYKMLDQLLLRHDDQGLWRQSATSLQYLVLDEFHTYDGAQGTDVAMLLRRLGLALKSHWRDDDPLLNDEDRARPLGRVTPVATSATLGDKGDPAVMLDFAETVFGEVFPSDSVVTESRLTLAEWSGDAATEVAALGVTPVDANRIDLAAANSAVDSLGDEPTGEELARVVLHSLYEGDPSIIDSADPKRLLLLSQAHPLIRSLAEHASDAAALDQLVADVIGDVSFGRHGAGSAWATFLTSVVAALGHIRALAGRGALSVDTHLWIRELTRIDRIADSTASLRWGDDGPVGGVGEESRPSFPALYCRHCGRSGWGVGLAPVGQSLSTKDEDIRRNHAQREGRFRALLFAPNEGAAALAGEETEGLTWFSVSGRELLPQTPNADDPDLLDGRLLPVLTTTGPDSDKAAKDDDCPACGQADGIRFLGSAIATLLSVSLSTLFGSPTLDANEKKALVFTDSVQDAAHRAGFVQARSHALTLRGVLRASIAEGAVSLEQLVEDVLRAAGDDSFARYRILPPDLADRPSFDPFWKERTQRAVPVAVRNRVRRRLALDIAMEFGLNSRTGRTLELTGSVAAEVDAGQVPKIIGSARAALEGFAWQPGLDGTGGAPSDADLVAWVRGVLDRMRSQGAIAHPWFTKYRNEDGARYSIWGGRPRNEGMPAFPSGRPAPGYPRIGGSGDSDNLDPVTTPKSWYAIWTGRVLRVSAFDGGGLARKLFERLARDGALETTTSKTGAAVFALSPSIVTVAPCADADLAAGGHLLICDTCHATTPGSKLTVDQLDGAPCLVARCRTGRLRRSPLRDGFYRRLYASPDLRRIVAREHTGLLDDETRLAYENGFKSSSADPQAPNVLVATPTLEMGIDIGDLSAVFLSSLPRTVASYLQRVGRAGRLTGNALNLAFVTGRGDQLPKIGEPLSVINGEVRPPATYLRAEEILRRQYVAHLADTFARDTNRPHPNSASGAIGSSADGTFLGDLIAYNESDPLRHVERFADCFGPLQNIVVDALEEWSTPSAGPATSGMAATLHTASHRWQTTVENLRHRMDRLDAILPELTTKAGLPTATDEDAQALRSAQAARRLTAGQLSHLRTDYWIGVLEEYGVLPNYTLLDDAVVLDVGVSWIDPDSNTFQSEHAQIQRASAQAIREFAPGATFYARGYEIAIDAIDLGVDGTAIRPWVFCPACGFAQDAESAGVSTIPPECPRCGSKAISDTGQRLDVVELTHVTAEVRRDEAAISDRRDERFSKTFQIAVTADFTEADVAARWYVDGVGLGSTYLRSVDLRWLNLGQPGSGSTRMISGEERAGSLFKVCEGCGKLDIQPGRNLIYEHRPWCKHRTSPVEHNVTIALSRTLRTQGLSIRLPYSITLGDDFALPSLSAAILLGLREQLGGHPDHLAIERIIEPTKSDGAENHDGLLIHDIVPGGTGYLAEIASPSQLRTLLAVAWERVRDCECQHEERLACHRCLLPFVPPSQIRRVSRASAERHLRTLLALPDSATSAGECSWSITEMPPQEDPESQLEQLFRKVLIERLTIAGATVSQVPGPSGNLVRFTFPSSTRQWVLTPQENALNSRPDFTLRSNDTNVPPVSIFTDGRTWHATEAHNRLADDAQKRANLRAAGHVVLGISSRDLADEPPPPPPWYSDETVGSLINHPEFKATPGAYAALAQGPIDWLLHWVTEPNPADVGVVARATPMFLGKFAERGTAPDDSPLVELAREVLRGEAFTGTRPVGLYRSDALSVVVDFQTNGVAVVLDDRPGHLNDAHADSWRHWLRLSNALALRDRPTVITTVTATDDSLLAPVAPPDTGRRPVDFVWGGLFDRARAGAERDLVADLALQTGLAPPTLGAEVLDGIPIDVAWPTLHVAVDLGLTSEDRTELVEAGWAVLPPEADHIADEVGRRLAESSTGGGTV